MLILERPWTRQPQTRVQLNPSMRGGQLAFLPSTFSFVGLNGSIAEYIPSTLETVSDTYGRAVRFNNGTDRIKAPVNGTTLTKLSANMTFAMVWRARDTTARAACAFGCRAGSDTKRIILHAPYSDGNFYWDYATDAAGRVSGSWGGKSTNWETLVVVAGQNKGREVWRNGVRIGSNTASKAVPTDFDADFYIGSNNQINQNSDNVDVALFVAATSEWTDSEIISWHRNPYGSTFAPQTQRIWVPSAAAGVPTLSASTYVPGSLTATGWRPQITAS